MISEDEWSRTINLGGARYLSTTSEMEPYAKQQYIIRLAMLFRRRHAGDLQGGRVDSKYLWLMIARPDQDQWYEAKDPEPMLRFLRVFWDRVADYELEPLSQLLSATAERWMVLGNDRVNEKGFIERALDCVFFFFEERLSTATMDAMRTAFFAKPVLDALGKDRKAIKCARQVAVILSANRKNELRDLLLASEIEQKGGVDPTINKRKTRSATRKEEEAGDDERLSQMMQTNLTIFQRKTRKGAAEEAPGPSMVLFLLLAASC